MLKVDIVKNGVLIPRSFKYKHDLVYSEDCSIVEASLLVRGDGGFDVVSDYRQNIKYMPKKKVNERVVFLGYYDPNHYGHWITEGISRYWFLLNNDFDGCVFVANNLYVSIRKYVYYIKYNKIQSIAERSFDFFCSKFKKISFNMPVICSEIIIPQPSMCNRWYVDDVHRIVANRFAENIYVDNNKYNNIKIVYLSRTKLNSITSRNFIGEKLIEEYCAGKGYKVVHPELLSIEEQVNLFNSYDVFIGVIGSAFHSILLRFNSKKPKCFYICGDNIMENYNLIDKVMNVDAVYINAIRFDSDISMNKIDHKFVIKELSRMI